MSEPATVHPNPTARATSHTRLPGYWPLLARTLWVMLALPIIGLFANSLRRYAEQLELLCYFDDWDCDVGQLTPEQAGALQGYGLSLDPYIAVVVALAALLAAVWYIVAALIFWRKSDDWMALLVALMLLSFGTFITISPVNPLVSPWQEIAGVMAIVSIVLLLLVFALFPDGHFVPRWTRWLLVALIALVAPTFMLAGIVLAALPFINTDAELSWRSLMLLLALMLGSVAVAQIYRYRRVSTPTQRAQTKWVVVGVSVAILVLAGNFALSGVVTSIPGDPLVRLATSTILGIVSLLIPVTFGIAVLRHHLFDIDTIINRALVYSTLTAVLAVIYIGSMLVLQTLLHTITNQTSSVAVVVSTLATAALAQPLRRRVQRGIDRRFYRSKYDAARTLAAFSATLRGQVELAHLHAELVSVVQRTMQPAHISLWLSPPRRQVSQPPSTVEQ